MVCHQRLEQQSGGLHSERETPADIPADRTLCEAKPVGRYNSGSWDDIRYTSDVVQALMGSGMLGTLLHTITDPSMKNGDRPTRSVGDKQIRGELQILFFLATSAHELRVATQK